MTTKHEEKDYPSNAALVYDKIKASGDKEMSRDTWALILSAIAAGLSMGTSMLLKGILHAYLPNSSYSFLIESLGYSMGFVIVIMAKQQLFTENTVTAVIPAMNQPSTRNFYRLFRLWGLVLFGNLIGTFVIAFAFLHLPAFTPDLESAFLASGAAIMQHTPFEIFSRSIFAGWLVATMVWILPNAKYSKIFIIILMTSVIQMGEFTHIIVGSAEIFYYMLAGKITLWQYLYPFAIPTILGNIVGGTFIFTLLSHAQVRSDMNSD